MKKLLFLITVSLLLTGCVVWPAYDDGYGYSGYYGYSDYYGLYPYGFVSPEVNFFISGSHGHGFHGGGHGFHEGGHAFHGGGHGHGGWR